MKILSFLLIAVLYLSVSACNSINKNKQIQNNDSAKTTTPQLPGAKAFQQVVDGKQTNLFYIKNNNISVAITNYGARIVALIVPDKEGKMKDVVVGFDSLQPYKEGKDAYFGAVVGRYGNRIAKGKFSLDGKQYILAVNNPPNSLHGGNTGFSRRVWDMQSQTDSSLVFSYISKNGEEGYPGTLTVKVTYTTTNTEGLKIQYEVTTDKKTVANITNHSYFNLNGQGSGTINNHILMINAEKITAIDSTLIPNNILMPVAGTPFDFRTGKTIGENVDDSDNLQIKYGHGYDHNFVLNTSGNIIKKAAEVTGDQSGIMMDVFTTEPGIQFYGGNFMDGSHTIKNGAKDRYRTAFCLETQHFPDSPNHPSFPSTTLERGKIYYSTTIYEFGIKK